MPPFRRWPAGLSARCTKAQYPVAQITWHTIVLRLLIVVLTLAATSCQKGSDAEAVTLHKIVGSVFLDGKPVADANLVFLPTRLWNPEGQRQNIGYATTNEQGQYEVFQSDDQFGIASGRYRVLVSKKRGLDPKLAKPAQAISEFLRKSSPNETHELFRQQYWDEVIPKIYNELTCLELEVSDDSDKVIVDFRLSSVEPKEGGMQNCIEQR